MTKNLLHAGVQALYKKYLDFGNMFYEQAYIVFQDKSLQVIM